MPSPSALSALSGANCSTMSSCLARAIFCVSSRSLSGFPFKPPRSSFNTHMFRAEPWFEFDKRWNEAHDALLFDLPVKVATKDAVIVWIEHAKDPEPKHLQDLELLQPGRWRWPRRSAFRSGPAKDG